MSTISIIDDHKAVVAFAKAIEAEEATDAAQIAQHAVNSLQRALDRWSRHYADAVAVMHHDEGMSFREIGEALDISSSRAHQLVRK